MEDRHCHVPIQLRLAGQPTEEQLAGIAESLPAALTRQLDHAGQALAAGPGPAEPARLHPPTFAFPDGLPAVVRDRLRGVVLDSVSRALADSPFADASVRPAVPAPAPTAPPGVPAAAAAGTGSGRGPGGTVARPGGRPWRIRTRFSTRTRVRDFFDLLELLATSESFGWPQLAEERALPGALRAQYAAQLDEVRTVEVVLVEARLWVAMDEVTGVVLPRINRPVRRGRFAWYGWTTADLGRQRLAAIDRGGRSHSLPPLPSGSVLPWLGGRYFLRAGGLLLFVRMVLPEVRLEDVATIGEELIFSVRVSQLASVVDSDYFERLTGLPWSAYAAEFGDEPAGLYVLPVFPRRRVRAETLQYLVDRVVAGRVEAGAAYFGRLRLLNRATLGRLPPTVARDPTVAALAVRDPPADREAGVWEPGWPGAFVYATPDLADHRLRAARLRWKAARIAAGQPEPPPAATPVATACEPYLGEPAVEALPEGSEELMDRILQLAADLGVPPCRWAGRFAFECAAAIRKQARVAGLEAAADSTTTVCTVRPDGSGNNGWLDVKPGDTPELRRLRLLAAAVADLQELSALVVQTYRRPVNATLVFRDPGRVGEPHAVGWALDFSSDLRRALVLACTHLYAETCRVLFLQQLRYSRAAIEQHLSPAGFPKTLEHFREALGILGESAVVISTLRLAVRHAARVSTSGSVRDVLSVRERAASRVEGQEVELPAPIDSVPQRLLDLLAASRIEWRGSSFIAVHAGRDWSADQLAEALAARRALLNQVDPLFLQVEDLDRLYRETVTNPASLGSYLERLLGEMRDANIEMLTKAKAAESGAFFALEASQWVEASGGRDARGLKFDLQGIHGLADDQLRPHAGGVAAYTAGINAAIGRKAGFDTMVAFVSGVGIIVLGLLCAPLGATVVALVTAGAGLAFTAYDVAQARELERKYRALVDPEAIVRWQEVELARLVAAIGVAFSIFDVFQVGRAASEIVSGVARSARLAERVGAGGAAIALTRRARRQLVRNMSEELLQLAVRHAVRDVVVAKVMEMVLPQIIEPVLVPWLREQAVQHGTLAGVDAALGSLVEAYTSTGAAAPADWPGPSAGPERQER